MDRLTVGYPSPMTNIKPKVFIEPLDSDCQSPKNNNFISEMKMIG